MEFLTSATAARPKETDIVLRVALDPFGTFADRVTAAVTLLAL